MNIDDLKSKINEVAEEFLGDMTQGCDRKATGLDVRAVPYTYWYDEDNFVIPADARRTLDYYGGFEYIEPEYVTTVGDYVVYSGEHDRVRSVLDRLNDVQEEHDEDEEE